MGSVVFRKNFSESHGEGGRGLEVGEVGGSLRLSMPSILLLGRAGRRGFLLFPLFLPRCGVPSGGVGGMEGFG